MLGLKWQDVDFERRLVSIRRAITMRQVTTPKSGRERSVAITETLAEERFDLMGQQRQKAALKSLRGARIRARSEPVGKSE